MAQSIKRRDGSYIDTEGIYDAGLKQTQSDINASDRFKILYRNTEPFRSCVFKTTSSFFFILSRHGLWNVYGDNGLSRIAVIDSAITYAVSRTLDADGVTYTYTLSRTDGNEQSLTYGGIIVFV